MWFIVKYSIIETPKKHYLHILFEKFLSKAIYVLQHGKIQHVFKVTKLNNMAVFRGVQILLEWL